MWEVFSMKDLLEDRPTMRNFLGMCSGWALLDCGISQTSECVVHVCTLRASNDKLLMIIIIGCSQRDVVAAACDDEWMFNKQAHSDLKRRVQDVWKRIEIENYENS